MRIFAIVERIMESSTMPQTIDIEQYAELIEKLKYSHAKPWLKAAIEKHLGINSTPPKVFKINSEIKRRARLSYRPFRIEQYVPGADEHYFEHSGIVHHCDPLTEKEFVSELKRYHNQYTMGVEEHVIKFVEKNKEKISRSYNLKSLSVMPTDISEVMYRKEERMYFGIKCALFIINQAADLTVSTKRLTNERHMIPCVTQNISESGIAIKSHVPPAIGSYCVIRVIGIEEEFSLRQPYVLYKCVSGKKVGKDSDAPMYNWGFSKQEHPCHADFDLLVTKIIKINRARYKIELVSTQRSVTNKVTEQFMTNREEEIFVFANEDGDAPIVFGSYSGKSSFDFFDVDGESNSHLGNALKKDHVIPLTLNRDGVWAVVVKKNKVCFSALIKDDPESILLLHYIMSRNDSMIFSVKTAVTSNENAFLSCNLPETSATNRPLKKQQNWVEHYAQSTCDLIQQISTVTTIKQIDLDVLAMLAGKPNISISKEEKSFLSNKYSLKESPNKITFIAARGRELRQEDRFKLRTRVRVSSRGYNFNATTINFSVSGLCILMSGIDSHFQDEIFEVEFLDMPYIDGVKPVMRYKIVSCDRGMLHFQSASTYDDTYTSLFIDKEFDELEPVNNKDNGGVEMVGLERALRNLKNAIQPHVKGIIQNAGALPIPSHINISKHCQDPLKHLYSRKYTDCLFSKSIFTYINVQERVSEELKKTNAEKPFTRHLMLIATDQNGQVKKVAIYPNDSDMHHEKVRNIYNLIKSKGLVSYWYQLDITRKARTFDRYYRDELNYINAISLHKGECISDFIRKTSGIFVMTPLNDVLQKALTSSMYPKPNNLHVINLDSDWLRRRHLS
jgi:hypothetical protein